MNNQSNYFKTNISNMLEDVISSNKASKFSSFLTEQEQLEATKIMNHYHFDNYMFFGGGIECERVVLGVFVDYIQPNINEFSICSIKIVPTDKNATSISHRDYLGAILGLQIKRDVIGDIFCFEDYAVVFVKENLKEFILSNLDKVGKVRVKLSVVNGLEFQKTKKSLEIKGTVSSLRLDCVVAFLIAKSRGNATSLINAGVVTVNSSVVTNISKTLKTSDVIVIRGKGKFILGENLNKTKKDRLFITVEKLL